MGPLYLKVFQSLNGCQLKLNNILQYVGVQIKQNQRVDISWQSIPGCECEQSGVAAAPATGFHHFIFKQYIRGERTNSIIVMWFIILFGGESGEQTYRPQAARAG